MLSAVYNKPNHTLTLSFLYNNEPQLVDFVFIGLTVHERFHDRSTHYGATRDWKSRLRTTAKG